MLAGCAPWWSSRPTTRPRASRPCCGASARRCPTAGSWWSTTTAPTATADLADGSARSSADVAAAAAGEGRPGHRLPRRFRRAARAGLRHPRRDGRRPLPRPARAARPGFGGRRTGPTSPSGRRYVAGGSTPDWTWRRAFLSRWGNRYAALGAGPGRERLHVRVPGLPGRRPAAGRPRPRPGLRLRLPGRDDLPPHQPGRSGRGDPRRLRRPPRRRVQDVAPDRPRGVRARHRLGRAGRPDRRPPPPRRWPRHSRRTLP